MSFGGGGPHRRRRMIPRLQFYASTISLVCLLLSSSLCFPISPPIPTQSIPGDSGASSWAHSFTSATTVSSHGVCPVSDHRTASFSGHPPVCSEHQRHLLRWLRQPMAVGLKTLSPSKSNRIESQICHDITSHETTFNRREIVYKGDPDESSPVLVPVGTHLPSGATNVRFDHGGAEFNISYFLSMDGSIQESLKSCSHRQILISSTAHGNEFVVSLCHRRRSPEPTSRSLKFTSFLIPIIGGCGTILQNPSTMPLELMGLTDGLYIYFSYWVFRVVFSIVGLSLLVHYVILKTVHYLVWDYALIKNSTSLPNIHSKVRESLFAYREPLLQRAYFPAWVILEQRPYSHLEKFQTALKRSLYGYLKAATVWSTFGNCATTRIEQFDLIDGVRTSMFFLYVFRRSIFILCA